MKKIRVIVSVITLICILFALAPTGSAVTQAEIDALQAEADALQEQADAVSGRIEEIQVRIEVLSEEKAQTLEKKELLDEQCSLLEDKIKNTEDRIVKYDALIDEAQTELDKAIAEEQDQYELMCTRVRTIEEGGRMTYWQILFTATSFTDMLAKIDFIKQVKKYDNNVIEEYHRLEEQTITKRTTYENYSMAAQMAKDSLEEDKAALEEKRAEAIAYIEELAGNIEVEASLREEAEAELAAAQAQVDAKEAELAEQMAIMEEERRQREEARLRAEEERRRQEKAAETEENGEEYEDEGEYYPDYSYRDTLNFWWPCGGYGDITSYFGYRDASETDGIGSIWHGGIDIGNVGYYTTVCASESGYVTYAGYASDCGNWIIISHGSGYCTYYLHLSEIWVSEGQWVDQGEGIGVTGSTGHSTGPHLDFRIVVDGECQDPLWYL